MSGCLRCLLFVFLAGAANCSAAPVTISDQHLLRLTRQACAFYDGRSMSDYLDPLTSTLNNPLLASELGQLIYRGSFRNAYTKNVYFHPNELIDSILEQPDLESTLRQCYGSNDDARRSFIFFVAALDSQGKTSAGILRAGLTYATLEVPGALFMRVGRAFGASKILLGKATKWWGRAVTTMISAELAKAGYTIYDVKTNPMSRRLVDASRKQDVAINSFGEMEKTLCRGISDDLANLSQEIAEARAALARARTEPQQRLLQLIIDHDTRLLSRGNHCSEVTHP